MSATPISELRRQLRERFPTAHESRRPGESYTLAGLPPLPKGTISELVTPPTVSGSSLLISQLLEQDPSELPLALIDPSDSFDPASYHPRRPLLWLRSSNPAKSLQAAELLLRDGNIPFVLLDYSLTPLRELRSIPATSWYRLRTLSESTGTSLLALTPHPSPLTPSPPHRRSRLPSPSRKHLHPQRPPPTPRPTPPQTPKPPPQNPNTPHRPLLLTTGASTSVVPTETPPGPRVPSLAPRPRQRNQLQHPNTLEKLSTKNLKTKSPAFLRPHLTPKTKCSKTQKPKTNQLIQPPFSQSFQNQNPLPSSSFSQKNHPTKSYSKKLRASPRPPRLCVDRTTSQPPQTELWTLDSGLWTLDSGFWILDSGF